MWARSRLRDLEDRRAAGGGGFQAAVLERLIVETSLRFRVLCRFTAFVAIDPRVVTDGSDPHRVIQPVEPADGWAMLAEPARKMRVPGQVPMAPGPMTPLGATLARQREPAPATFSAAAQAAEEAARLRAVSAPPEPERRALLADLGTRLMALASHLADVDTSARLRELAEALRACEGEDPPSGAELEALWTRTLEFLDELAVGTPPPAGRRRFTFWRS